jgi:transposase
MARKKYQHYTEEFRREAVKRADQPGNTVASVAKELGIHPGQIYNWRRQFTRLSDKQFNSLGVDYSKPESDEARQLKRERDALKKEPELVKKTADGWPPPYFASQHD